MPIQENESAHNHNNQAAPSHPAASPGSTGGGTETRARVQVKHVLILGALTAFAPLSSDIYLPSLPAVSHDLGATMSLTQITLTACIIGLALGQVIAGPVSDSHGRRGPLLIGIAIYTLASLLCCVAPTIEILAALRFMQGLGGAAGIAIALAIARDLYSGSALARSVSMLMTVNFLAPIVAPVLGGQLPALVSWRGVFVLLMLFGIMAFVAAALGLGETLPADRRQRSSLHATARAFRSLLENRLFMGYALTSGFAFAAAMVYISMSPFVLENLYGLSPQVFGAVFGINALGLAGMSQFSARAAGKIPPQKLLAGGITAMVAAGAGLLLTALIGTGLAAILPLLFILVASLGLIAPNATALALAGTDAGNAGSASGLLGLLQFSIGAVLAPLIGLSNATTAVPMAAAIAAFGLTALSIFLASCRPKPAV